MTACNYIRAAVGVVYKIIGFRPQRACVKVVRYAVGISIGCRRDYHDVRAAVCIHELVVGLPLVWTHVLVIRDAVIIGIKHSGGLYAGHVGAAVGILVVVVVFRHVQAVVPPVLYAVVICIRKCICLHGGLWRGVGAAVCILVVVVVFRLCRTRIYIVCNAVRVDIMSHGILVGAAVGVVYAVEIFRLRRTQIHIVCKPVAVGIGNSIGITGNHVGAAVGIKVAVVIFRQARTHIKMVRYAVFIHISPRYKARASVIGVSRAGVILQQPWAAVIGIRYSVAVDIVGRGLGDAQGWH